MLCYLSIFFLNICSVAENFVCEDCGLLRTRINGRMKFEYSVDRLELFREDDLPRGVQRIDREFPVARFQLDIRFCSLGKVWTEGSVVVNHKRFSHCGNLLIPSVNA